MTDLSDASADTLDSANGTDTPSIATGVDAATLAAPAKFLDPETGNLRVDALMKSYSELEKRMGAGAHLPSDRVDDADAEGDGTPFPDGLGFEDVEDELLEAEFDTLGDDDPLGLAADGVPDDPDGYAIEAAHPWLQSDPVLNAVLHDHGFNQDQAQVIYDLAHEHVLPLVEQLTGEIAALRGEGVLREVFPGDDWQAQADQTRQWAETALPPDLYESLAATPAGIAAMHRLMQHGEPDFLSARNSGGNAVEEASLRRLMDDPRYWREHDPDIVARVQDGFRRLYPD